MDQTNGFKEAIKAQIGEKEVTYIKDLLSDSKQIQDIPMNFGIYLDFNDQLQRLSITDKEEIREILSNLMKILKPNVEEEPIWLSIEESIGKLRENKEEDIVSIAICLNYICEMLSYQERDFSEEKFLPQVRFRVKPEV